VAGRLAGLTSVEIRRRENLGPMPPRPWKRMGAPISPNCLWSPFGRSLSYPTIRFPGWP